MTHNSHKWTNYAPQGADAIYSVGYPSETHAKTQFSRNFVCPFLITRLSSRFDILRRARRVLPCSAKNQNDSSNDMNVIGEKHFSRFEFKMSFGQISYIARASDSYRIPHSLVISSS